jgi:putative phage-type endonuclease
MDRNRWLNWRSKGIGASDSTIIAGVSPWMTREDLWAKKIGQKKADETSNWAIDRGNKLEPIARAHYELMVGFESQPILCEHREYPFIRASLDGYNHSRKIVLEIKCPGRVDHDKALRGKIPLKYYPQVQHQLFVTNALLAHYFSFDGKNGVIVEIFPDLEYISWLLNEIKIFWDCINKKIPPPDLKKISIGDGIAE